MDSPRDNRRVINTIPWWVKSILMISVTGVICYKLIITPFNLQFDFPSLLSLLLALFSVALAAMFYFKATDTSNAFYDNTYKFTQEIANLLVRIESGFGEKLSHLDDAYKGMRERFEQWPNKPEIKETKKELKQEEQELQKILNEKEKIIKDMLNKAQLREEEKEKFMNELNTKEEALQEAQQEISFLKRKLARHDRVQNKQNISVTSLKNDINRYIHNEIIPRIGGKEYITNRPNTMISRRFRRNIDEFHPFVIEKMREFQYIDESNNLTPIGIEEFLKNSD